MRGGELPIRLLALTFDGMIDDIDELLHQAGAGTLLEHRFPNVQLKAQWKQDNGHQLCGKANDLKAPSAWMVIGLHDDGSCCRKDETWVKSQEEVVSGHLNQYLDPPQACTYIKCHQIRLGWILVIGVSNPGTVVRWGGKAYASAGTTCREMTPEAALEMAIALPGLQDPSAQPWDGPINAACVQDFARRVAAHAKAGDFAQLPTLSAEEILTRLHLRGTVASRVLFGDTSCRVVVYDIGDNVIRNTPVAPLYTLLTPDFQRSLSLMVRGAPTANHVWPPLALSEGIANAVAHAAYFERSGELTIELHPNWICISNLCVQEAAAFANKWFSRSHSTLNVLLMESLRLARLVDELGRGKHLILREYLLAGRHPPSVAIEPAGRLSRWRLTLPTDSSDERVLRMLTRLRETCDGDERTALLGLALCLWRDKPLSEVRRFADAESNKCIDRMLEDFIAPVFVTDQDDIVLLRWARLILQEGLDSKQFSAGEEERLLKFTYRMQSKYDSGSITPKRLRELAQMSESKSERTLSSTMLRRWEVAGYLSKSGVGKFRFLAPPSGAPHADSTAPLTEPS